MCLEQLDQAALHRAVVEDRIPPAADAGLIRDNDDEIAVLVETLDGVGGAGQQLDFPGLVEKTGVFDDGAVAVQEDSAVAISHWLSVPQ